MKKEKYDLFMGRLEGRIRKKKMPFRVIFELTYRCNHRCIHCYLPKSRQGRELSTKGVFRILDDLARAGCFLLAFSGGEPFVRKDIFDILFYAKKKGFSIMLLTNGTLIDERAGELLKEIAPRKVDITILGASDATFDAITRRKGSFKKVMGALNILKKNKIIAVPKCMMLKDNAHEFFEMKKILDLHGKDSFRFDYSLHSALDGNRRPLKHRLSAHEGEALWQKINSEETDYGRGNAKKVFDCSAGEYACSIDPYGNMHLCPSAPYPKHNILKEGFVPSWKKLVRFVKNFKPGKDFACPSCFLKAYCNWCPAQSFLETGKFDRCEPFSREKALIRQARAREHSKEL